MNNFSNKQRIAILTGLFVVIFGIIFFITKAGSDNSGNSEEKAAKRLANILDDIKIKEASPIKATITDEDILEEQEELPDITKYPLTITGDKELNIEIFVSPEKAGSGTDGWMNEVAKKFNKSNPTVNGKEASVSIRSVSSGLAVDYITSGKYVPDAITPSNDLWGKMIEAKNIQVEMVAERLVGNQAGILLSKKTYDKMVSEYGAVNMKSITEATANNEIKMGYTNPFTSSTGMNFLISTLYCYDSSDLLSDKAIAGFVKFQENVPLVSFNTLQMRKSAESGSLSAFVLEYQTYINDAALKSEYVFTPFGLRHDNPMYAVGELSEDKMALLKMFTEYCLNAESQKLATDYGFNANDNYKSEMPNDFSGATLISAQKLYKTNKNTSKTIMAVFVADVSGSMNGPAINNLRTSLLNSMQYINSDNYIGLISYSTDVTINLPVAKFDINQQSLFKGAVQSLDTTGNTATYDAVAVAINMLDEAKAEAVKEAEANGEAAPDIKPLIFLLSDGQQNSGCSLKDIRGIVEAYGYPIYSIGYNENIAALEELSSINEAATIKSQSDDIIYQLKNLFNSEM
ncbi:MAG: VWA domain-containing protein [Lachnospiraceae bacterium]|nr:VWA domain-containing protein [Lachnospiraceae bacterium]